MAVTTNAIEVPSFEESNSVAAFLGSDKIREDVAREIEQEVADGGIIDTGLESLTPTGFSYTSKLDMERDPARLVQEVLNHPEKLADIASDPQTFERFVEGVGVIEQAHSTLDKILSGDLQLGDAGRTQLREISLQLGNLHQVPRQLVHTMRLWTMNERNGGADQVINAEHNPNIPTEEVIDTEKLTHRLVVHDAARQVAGTAMDQYDQSKIDAIMEGPATPELVREDPELVATTLGR